MKISAELLDQIVDHAREHPRQEVCGIIAAEPRGGNGAAGSDGGGEQLRAVAVHRATNIHASPLKFEIAPKELYDLISRIEDAGQEVGGIYHSHVRSAPYPSQTDINFAAGWPGLEWLIVGFASPDQPEVRSYVIDGSEVREVPI